MQALKRHPTLQHLAEFDDSVAPLQEGNVKLQQVRKFVHNRCTAGPTARLRIWHSTVWATASGMADGQNPA